MTSLPNVVINNELPRRFKALLGGARLPVVEIELTIELFKSPEADHRSVCILLLDRSTFGE